MWNVHLAIVSYNTKLRRIDVRSSPFVMSCRSFRTFRAVVSPRLCSIISYDCLAQWLAMCDFLVQSNVDGSSFLVYIYIHAASQFTLKVCVGRHGLGVGGSSLDLILLSTPQGRGCLVGLMCTRHPFWAALLGTKATLGHDAVVSWICGNRLGDNPPRIYSDIFEVGSVGV
jgi:hypothetical protein